MNIEAKIPANRNVVSISLAGFFMAGGVILLLFLVKNFEVDPSSWAFFFSICKWMTVFMFMIIYASMALEAYISVMKWFDAKNIETVAIIDPEQVDAIN